MSGLEGDPDREPRRFAARVVEVVLAVGLSAKVEDLEGGRDRGRITLPFLLIFGVAIAYLGALYPVFISLFNDAAGSMDTGTEYLFLLALPFLVLVIISLIFLKAIGGRGGAV